MMIFRCYLVVYEFLNIKLYCHLYVYVWINTFFCKKPNRTEPHWFSLVQFNLFLKANQTKPNRTFFFSWYSDDFSCQNHPNCIANTPTYNNHNTKSLCHTYKNRTLELIPYFNRKTTSTYTCFPYIQNINSMTQILYDSLIV